MAGKTYESLYKQKTEVYVKFVASTYAVEHIVVGIVSAVVLYIIALSPLGVIFTLFGLFQAPIRFLMPLILAFTIAALSALIDPGKKPLPLYLWGAVSYFFKPKAFIGGHRALKRRKRRKEAKTRVKQQTTYTVSIGPMTSPVMLIGQTGSLNLMAAMEATRVRGGIRIRRTRSRVGRRALRLPYGRVTLSHEGRGRVGYHR